MEWKLFIQALIAVVSAIVTTEFCRWVKSASDDLETLQGSLNFYRAVLIADIVNIPHPHFEQEPVAEVASAQDDGVAVFVHDPGALGAQDP